MKVAITAGGQRLDDPLDQWFGLAKYLIIVDSDTNEVTVVNNVMNINAAEGAGIQAAQNVSKFGAEAVITGNVGPKAFRALAAAGISVYLCRQGTVSDALRKFRAGELTEATGANVHGHSS